MYEQQGTTKSPDEKMSTGRRRLKWMDDDVNDLRNEGVRQWRNKDEGRRECAGIVRQAKVKFKVVVLFYVQPLLGNVLVHKFP
jgi:hypothetical protein